MIDADGALTIAPLEGQESGELESVWNAAPWIGYYKDKITSAKVVGNVVAPTAVGMFRGCERLRSVDLTSLDTSRATSMNSMFSGCLQLTSIDLSPLDTANVTDMGSMFRDCPKLTSIDLSPLNTSNVTNMNAMFWRCTSLSSLDLSPLDTSNVTDMGFMFAWCPSLTSLDLSSFNTENVNDMHAMFDGCSSLETVKLGANFSFTEGSNGRQCAFPTPTGVGRTGLWVSTADDNYYAPDAIPNNVAATYSAQKAAQVFPDVDYNEWYGSAVSFTSIKGLLTGYSDTKPFGVGDTLTRGQLATILWRNACPDEAKSYDPATAKNNTKLTGIEDGMYYTAAANWAVREGVITGFERGDGKFDFAANSPVTFEQLIVILARIGADEGDVAAVGSDLSAFADGGQADTWAATPLAWAAQKGLVTGYNETDGMYLRPAEEVARERVAVILMRTFEMDILK